MTRFWIRNLTSRNDSRVGVVPMRRAPDGGPPVGGAPVGAGRLGPPVPGAVGAPVPAAPGRALSIRFRRLIGYTPSRPVGTLRSTPCEQRLLLLSLCRVIGRRDLRPFADHGLCKAEDVLRHLRVLVAQVERYAPVQGVDHAPPVARDRVVHLAPDRLLDVRDADAEGRIAPVEDEPDLALLVAELVGHLEEQAHVL